MRRRWQRGPGVWTCLLVPVCALGPAPSFAAAQAAASCSYDECALRMDARGFVLAGQRGARSVGRLGFLHPPDLAELFASSDSATAYFRIVEDDYTDGAVLSVLGVLTFLAAGTLLNEERVHPEHDLGRWEIGLLAVSIPLLSRGTHKANRARDALATAIWWYNRGLPSSGDVR